jgi:hypothetical protein
LPAGVFFFFFFFFFLSPTTDRLLTVAVARAQRAIQKPLVPIMIAARQHASRGRSLGGANGSDRVHMYGIAHYSPN